MMGYILIVGGQMGNKGAQAMVFTVINELGIEFPGKEPVMLCINTCDECEATKYSFRIVNVNKKEKIEVMGGIYKVIGKFLQTKVSSTQIENLKQILLNTEMIIDVSGFALSSHFSIGNSLNYISNIILAKQHKIPMYIMPQSFGPFEYHGIYKYVLRYLIKKYLKYPTKVFAREKEGFNLMQRFLSGNLYESVDIVLQGRHDYKISCLYRDAYVNTYNINIPAHAIGIIPSVKILRYGTSRSAQELYYIAVEYLLQNGKIVYLLKHSKEDGKLCDLIKERYKNEKKVVLIQEELDCINVQLVIKKFEFIITGRYHSIVHAYKNGIPVIAVGWATKYKELLANFSQEKYLLDIRAEQCDGEITTEVQKKIMMLMQRKEFETALIKKRIDEIQSDSIFDNLFLGDKVL